MTKRKRAAERRAADAQKFARRMRARLLTELLLTPNDGLDDFRRSLQSGDDTPTCERLGEMQAILDALGQALQQGSERDWRGVHEAWQAMRSGDADAASTSTSALGPARPRSDPPKPSLSDPAPAVRWPAHSPLPAPRPPRRPAPAASAPPAPPPAEPPRPALLRDPDEHTAAHALPHPQPPLPFGPGSGPPTGPPGELAPPDPDVPPPPVGPPGGAFRSPTRRDAWPPRADPLADPRAEEHTGQTDLIEVGAHGDNPSPALPFEGPRRSSGGASARPPSDRCPRGDRLLSDPAAADRPEGLGHPLAEALAAAGLSESPYDDDSPTLSKNNEAARTAARWLDAIDPLAPLDEQESTPQFNDLPWASALESIPVPNPGASWDDLQPPPETTRNHRPTADDTGPLPALDAAQADAEPQTTRSDRPAQASLLDGFADGNRTILGQPPGRLARLHSITMEQYASMRAEIAVFPERVDEVRRTLGLQGADEQLALDDLWDRRFAQNPDVRSLFDLLYTRYRAWLKHQGQG